MYTPLILTTHDSDLAYILISTVESWVRDDVTGLIMFKPCYEQDHYELLDDYDYWRLYFHDTGNCKTVYHSWRSRRLSLESRNPNEKPFIRICGCRVSTRKSNRCKALGKGGKNELVVV